MKINKNELEEDSDEEIRENIRESAKELREVLSGKKKAISMNDFLKELDDL